VVATNLIELTQVEDGVKVQIAVMNILHVHPFGTGSSVEFTNGYTVHVTETPTAIKTAANA
jgi:hypothetical protein